MLPYVQLTFAERQFRAAINEISLPAAMRLNTPSDRIRIAEWIQKLTNGPSSSCSSGNWLNTNNEYAQYLRLMMRYTPLRLVSPFTRPPPQNDLPPLSEMLANTIQQSLVQYPRTGPIKPVICHTCAEGKAFMSVQRCPQSGAVYCYMAVAPDTLQKHSQTEQENA